MERQLFDIARERFPFSAARTQRVASVEASESVLYQVRAFSPATPVAGPPWATSPPPSRVHPPGRSSPEPVHVARHVVLQSPLGGRTVERLVEEPADALVFQGFALEIGMRVAYVCFFCEVNVHRTLGGE
jgi:hypothetical protein